MGTFQRAGGGARPASVAQEAKITPESQAEEAAAAGKARRIPVGPAGFHRYMEAYVSMVIGGTAKYILAFVLISGDEGFIYSLPETASAPENRKIIHRVSGVGVGGKAGHELLSYQFGG